MTQELSKSLLDQTIQNTGNYSYVQQMILVNGNFTDNTNAGEMCSVGEKSINVLKEQDVIILGLLNTMEQQVNIG